MSADAVQQIEQRWREILPWVDSSPLLVVARIMRIAERCDALLRPPFADAGLAGGDFDALAALRRADRSLSPGELGEAMLVTSGAVTKRVDRLEAAGLVVRTRSEHDGRGRAVTLTDAGRELVDRLFATHMVNERAILRRLSAAQQRDLAGLLGRLLVSVEADAAR